MIKTCVKNLLLFVFRKVLDSHEGKKILFEAINGSSQLPSEYKKIDYDEFPCPYIQKAAMDEKKVIFITGRFRSGSTLVWNLFRHNTSCTAYYEPFNERRWFCKKTRGEKMDLSHRKVTDYWSEYDPHRKLSLFYQESWIRDHLYMDSKFWDENMYFYIKYLIDNTDNIPVLQFNRIDFRLPWIRHNFPQAKIIHVYRHPREQWCSTLVNISKFSYRESFETFDDNDHFYLMNWKNDLQNHFCFLRDARNPYQVFYYLWRLSYFFGAHYSDVSVSLEDLIEAPERNLATIMQYTPNHNIQNLKELIVANKKQQHLHYAPVEWFEEQEQLCEKVLKRFFTKSI
ncbi:sulfotransferase [Candidatus Uabimicrobium amorphum]|uniref:Sulfotransferase family protein n=1 Tax=Uabimicrobium amorphum TaxID=2596890 RepID=A0A5S9INQ5_UABAM|nr:sulfotransferase [Candidatus Uabimicrobium amorphum]BBM85094.1 hypothetical protein UABAM_03457 [Candidatus Uabimicrobium amorphum]